MLPSFYEEVDRGGLFVIRLEDFSRGKEVDEFVVKILVINQTIDESWFNEALIKCFSSDRGAKLEENMVIITTGFFIKDVIDFLNQKADELMDVLKTHPKWGKVGGPDGLSDYLFVE